MFLRKNRKGGTIRENEQGKVVKKGEKKRA
jgi:hypothetical protein